MGYMVTDGPEDSGTVTVDDLAEQFGIETEGDGLNEAINCLATALIVNDAAIYDDPTKWETLRLVTHALVVLQTQTHTSASIDYTPREVRTTITHGEERP